ncbi:MAG: YgiT-type zinc finger protein [Desulfococcaceae bacterium]|jgi:YgiT-type zinc finger domain-containing protein|nr:YgiT-type zinc finger protein [Desulfococcaceae bacterium]
MECYYCKGDLQEGVVPYFVKRKGYQIVIDRVPAYICSQCGEYMFREKEVDLIQEIISLLEQKIAMIIPENLNYAYICNESSDIPIHHAL